MLPRSSLRGTNIRKGLMLTMSFDSVRRDPAVHDDPDRFDVTRDVDDLVTFGPRRVLLSGRAPGSPAA
jgi:cytochrome P450